MQQLSNGKWMTRDQALSHQKHNFCQQIFVMGSENHIMISRQRETWQELYSTAITTIPGLWYPLHWKGTCHPNRQRNKKMIWEGSRKHILYCMQRVIWGLARGSTHSWFIDYPVGATWLALLIQNLSVLHWAIPEYIYLYFRHETFPLPNSTEQTTPPLMTRNWNFVRAVFP